MPPKKKAGPQTHQKPANKKGVDSEEEAYLPSEKEENPKTQGRKKEKIQTKQEKKAASKKISKKIAKNAPKPSESEEGEFSIGNLEVLGKLQENPITNDFGPKIKNEGIHEEKEVKEEPENKEKKEGKFEEMDLDLDESKIIKSLLLWFHDDLKFENFK